MSDNSRRHSLGVILFVLVYAFLGGIFGLCFGVIHKAAAEATPSQSDESDTTPPLEEE